MQNTTATFRGNPHHLAVLTDAAGKKDISLWNTFVRRNGAAFRPRLAGADLSGLNLGEARLDRADLTDVNLSGAILLRANLSEARLRGADLSGANLTGARLLHSDFSNANLQKADLSGTRAHGAVFNGADLRGTRLDNADLSRASLGGASVSGASGSGSKLKVRVKVKARIEPSSEAENREKELIDEGDYSPWIRALEEEERLKELRRIREQKKADAEKTILDRKLGRRKPLFNRIK